MKQMLILYAHNHMTQLPLRTWERNEWKPSDPFGSCEEKYHCHHDIFPIPFETRHFLTHRKFSTDRHRACCSIGSDFKFVPSSLVFRAFFCCVVWFFFFSCSTMNGKEGERTLIPNVWKRNKIQDSKSVFEGEEEEMLKLKRNLWN